MAAPAFLVQEDGTSRILLGDGGALLLAPPAVALLQFSVAVRNARLDAIEVVTGAGAVLRIRSGPPPSDCNSSNIGSVLATLALPVDWMAAAANGSKAKQGVWSTTDADATGIAGHFRLYTAGGICTMQGCVTVSGGGGDIEVDNINFVAGRAFSITIFALTEGNA